MEEKGSCINPLLYSLLIHSFIHSFIRSVASLGPSAVSLALLLTRRTVTRHPREFSSSFLKAVHAP